MTEKTKVYLDTCCFIDLASHQLNMPIIDKRESHIFICQQLIRASQNQDINVYTSSLTSVECRYIKDRTSTPPKKIITQELKDLFNRILMSGKSGVYPVMPTPKIIELSKDLEWKYEITTKPFDSLHIATALSMKCTHFITTDDIGTENIIKIRELGLIVAPADNLSGVLPHKYLQMPLDKNNRLTLPSH